MGHSSDRRVAPAPKLNADGNPQREPHPRAATSWSARIRAQAQERWGSLQLIVRYVAANMDRNYRSFVIGLSTVLLVVSFLALVQNALVRSGIVFVKLSEDTVGQYDLLLTPNAPDISPYINYTQLNSTLARVPYISSSVPRWLLPVNISSPNASVWDPSVPDPVVASAYLLVIDTQLEAQAGVGVAWPFRALGEAEAHVTGSLLRSVRKRPGMGDRINVKLNPLALFGNGASGNATDALGPQQGTNVTLTSAQVDQLAIATGTSREQLLSGAEQLPDGRFRLTIGGANNANGALSVGSLSTLTQPFTIVSAIDKPQGKYPQALGNVIVVDRAPTEVLIKRTLATLLTNPVVATSLGLNRTQVDTFRLADYAMSVVAMVRDREPMYMSAATDRQRQLVRVTDAMAREMGADAPVDVVDGLNQALRGTQFIQIYMNEIFFTVVAVLSVLAVLLIYSLLLADVEEKTFEFGMLRSLGMKQGNLIGLVLVQSLWFSVPGISAGLLICFVLYTPVEYILSSFSAVPMSLGLDPSAIVLGFGLGLGLPLVAMLVPIRRALSQTLRDALDLFHNSVNDSVVTITKLREAGINVGETIISALLVTVGFLVYYVIPLSFTFNNLPLFFRILTLILLAMVVGQVLMGQVLQHFLELIAMRLVVFMFARRGRAGAIANVVSKNLGAHIKRNGKTALMMSLLLAYIIFAAVMFKIQSDTLSETLEWQYGADIVVRGSSFAKPVPEVRISNFLVNRTEATGSASGMILGWTYIAYPVNNYWPVRNSRLGPVTSLRNPTVRIVGVQQNLLQVALAKYYIPVTCSPSIVDPHDVVSRLTDILTPADIAGTGAAFTIPDNPPIVRASDLISGTRNVTDAYKDVLPVVISEALATRAFIQPSTNLILELDIRTADSLSTTTQRQLARTLCVARKVPGIGGISRFAQSRSPVLVSMAQAANMLSRVDTWSGALLTNATDVKVADKDRVDARVLQDKYLPDMRIEVPKQTALIRLRKGLSSLQIEGIINELNTAIADDDFKVDNLRFQLESTELAAFFINILFYIVAFVGILLAFFVLWLSFTANLRENAWEFGVLRAIGLDGDTVINIYIYEAIAIVLATIALGSAIGILTALVLTLQFGLFTEMPFSFGFPVPLYVTVTVLSLVVAVAGSWYPATEFARKKIAIALKGL
ncbi:FtsX-like permease family-domain-containing protein [Catenaria anguillulae PL171]|uniref:FtsX-like permease family-domain-containing protein n=1 Tax=Catenaria anguillulae PL171 TaxID=765915 RepID=A0A1Y2HB00_9FUNG|nr:FtsX-like permease family-domain-containing protein [Catenaria anguillulae PL171]